MAPFGPQDFLQQGSTNPPACAMTDLPGLWVVQG
jgi:hypothetical protein